jgi:SAM-dependent methyltransferase
LAQDSLTKIDSTRLDPYRSFFRDSILVALIDTAINQNQDIKIIDLGFHPYADTFIKKNQLNYSEPVFQLSCYLNKQTGIIRNSIITDAKSRYNLYDYSYTSSNSKYSRNYWEEYSKNIKQELKINENSKILEVGSNDGFLLECFRKYTKKIWGVDASKFMCSLTKKNKIKTFNLIFSQKNSKKIKNKIGKVDVIISNNVLNHSNDVLNFIRGAKNLLNQDGTFIFELPYWYNLVLHEQFDQIYHEHVYYYILQPLETLLDKFNLRIIKAVDYPIHGGSLRLIITHKGDIGEALQPCSSIKDKIEEESTLNEQYYKDWGHTIETHISNCKKFLQDLKTSEDVNIIGFGAAAKGCVFLNSAKIDDSIIDVVVDDTDIKQNKFIPGTGIKIVSRDYIKENKVDYILILAHNFKEVVIDSLKDVYKGKYILLFPNIKII